MRYVGSNHQVLRFADLQLYRAVRVYDIFEQQDKGVFSGSYTATGLAEHGTAFLRLTPQPSVGG